MKKIYRGAKHAKVGQVVLARYGGKASKGTTFLLYATEGPKNDYSALPVTLRGQQYIDKVVEMLDSTVKRLDFVEDYLADADSLLREDAFQEWFNASYRELKGVAANIDRDRLVGWINDNDPTAPRAVRQLFFRMLSVCGDKDDIFMLEKLLRSGDSTKLVGLDSLIQCYLTLAGPDGLPLIEDTFLRPGWIWDPKPVHSHEAIVALRRIGNSELAAIPRERLVESLRLMLYRGEWASLVLADLAHWEDWKSMPRLVQLYKEIDSYSLRVPIIFYLRACPLDAAKSRLAELRKSDPDTFRRLWEFAKEPQEQPCGLFADDV
jgi:hypothetical protein